INTCTRSKCSHPNCLSVLSLTCKKLSITLRAPLNKLRCCHHYCTANLPWNQYLKFKFTKYTDNRQTSTYFLLFLLFLLFQLTFQIGNPGTQFIYIFSCCNAEIFGHFLCLFILFGVPLICFHFAFIH